MSEEFTEEFVIQKEPTQDEENNTYEEENDSIQISKKIKGNDEVIDIIEEMEPENSQEQQKNNSSKPPKPKKPTTAYFWFLKEYKKKNILSDTQSSGAKNLKEFSEIWNSMTPDEKKIYIDMAAQDKERYNKEMENYRSIVPEGESSEDEANKSETSFPVYKIKNIMKSDEEINKIRKPVYELVTKLADAFGEYFLSELTKNMKNEKRKRIIPNDFVTVTKRVPNLRFLDEAKIYNQEEGSKEKKPAPAAKQPTEKKKVINTTKNHKISEFFIKKN